MNVYLFRATSEVGQCLISGIACLSVPLQQTYGYQIVLVPSLIHEFVVRNISFHHRNFFYHSHSTNLSASRHLCLALKKTLVLLLAIQTAVVRGNRCLPVQRPSPPAMVVREVLQDELKSMRKSSRCLKPNIGDRKRNVWSQSFTLLLLLFFRLDRWGDGLRSG